MSTNHLYITTTTGITLSNKNNGNNRHQQPLSLLTTRDELIALAQKEYARQLSKFTETQMKEKEHQLEVVTPLSALYTHHEQQRQYQQEQHYFNLPKTTKINNNSNFIHESSIYSISLNDTNKIGL
ncbi:hypothetical protein BDC45DRAFT_525194 [Circinella umbellata]|nr:hypothetical protein BDC45DRAFT_525194 [Circinella umbellata]